MSEEFKRAIEESGGHWSAREMLALANALEAIEQRLKTIEERLDGLGGWLQFQKYRQRHPRPECPPVPPSSKPPRKRIFTQFDDDGPFEAPVWECQTCGRTYQQALCPDTCVKCGYSPGFRKRPEASGL